MTWTASALRRSVMIAAVRRGSVVEVGKIEIIHEDRLLQIMELFHDEIDGLDDALGSMEEYQLQRKDILAQLKHKICALFY